MQTTFVPTPHQNDGFDEDASWVMLPDGGERRVHLLNGSTMSLHVVDPSVVRAKFADDTEHVSNRRTVILKGLDYGRTTVEAKLYGNIKARLHVSHYLDRPVKVNFYRVEDENGDVPIFNSSAVPDIIKGLNGIYGNQANLNFSSHLIREFVRVPGELAEKNKSDEQVRRLLQSLRDRANQLDPSPGHYHVFWMLKYGARDQPGKDVQGQAMGIPSQLCVVEEVDNPVEQLQIIAHELGHCFGAHHDKEHKEALMYPYTTGGKNRKLYQHAVEEIRGDP